MNCLFCSLGSPGFLGPFIGFARALQRRGHRVAVVTDAVCQVVLAEHGIRRIPRGRVDGPSFQVGMWAQPLSVAIQVKHIEHALGKFKADVLFAQSLTLGALACAERYCLPIAILGFVPYLWPAREPSALTARTEEERLRSWRHNDMIQHYNRARALLGLSPVSIDIATSPLLGDLFFLRSVPEFEPRAAELPDRVQFVGACIDNEWQMEAELEAWMKAAAASGKAIIYVHHGRVFDAPSFWAELIEALAPTEAHVAASVGRMDRGLGVVPSHWFVRGHVPQASVLAHASLMVASATSTAVLGALTAGVPSVLVPAGGEQPDLAALCARAGVARVIPAAEVTSEQLSREINTVLGREDAREACRRVSAAFKEIDGFEIGSDLLEALVRRTTSRRSEGLCQPRLSNQL